MAATSFAALKKSSKSSLRDLVTAAEKVTARDELNTNENIWKPEVDKAGNGYSVIRFLPAAPGEELPWVKVYNHGFQGPGGWWIDECRTTIGEKCPVCEHNSMLWNSGVESNKDIVRKQKRRLNYYSNVLVVSDKANPQNEGRVFLYRYGAKIFEKMQNAMQPQFEDEDPMNPFDFWEGANFKLKIRRYEGYQNYDLSEFDKSSAVSDDDAKIEEIWNSQHPLSKFLDVSEFKSYEEQKTRLNRVLGLDGGPELSEVAPAPQPRVAAAKEEDSVPWSNDDEEDDDSLSFFKKLAEED